MPEVLAILFIFGGGTLFLLSVSPIGRAYADRLRGKSAQAQLAPEELDDLRAQLQTVQEQVNELAERQDFTERLLAKTPDKGAIGPAKEAS
jgi:hypothetical protein